MQRVPVRCARDSARSQMFRALTCEAARRAGQKEVQRLRAGQEAGQE